MGSGDEIGLHGKRALAEIDLAARATSSEAAKAHLRLSSLHLERMRALAEKTAPAG